MQIDVIYNEDCLIGMQRIVDGSVDCIICDLPYGVLNKANPYAKWDCQLPLDKLWAQYLRIIKPNGAIILFGQGMFTAKLMMSQQKLWRYNLIWDKVRRSGFLNANRMPLRRHEDICVFYKSLPTYNPQMAKCEPNERNHSKGNILKHTKNRCYGNYFETPTIISDEKFPVSILTFPKKHKNGEWYHPTEKPVALIEYLIRTYTNEGELVLDNCMGSGTTAIACMNTNRHFLGFEISKDYYDIAVQRISAITPKLI